MLRQFIGLHLPKRFPDRRDDVLSHGEAGDESRKLCILRNDGRHGSSDGRSDCIDSGRLVTGSWLSRCSGASTALRIRSARGSRDGPIRSPRHLV
jgi:hypothetical protein